MSLEKKSLEKRSYDSNLLTHRIGFGQQMDVDDPKVDLEG